MLAAPGSGMSGGRDDDASRGSLSPIRMRVSGAQATPGIAIAPLCAPAADFSAGKTSHPITPTSQLARSAGRSLAPLPPATAATAATALPAAVAQGPLLSTVTSTQEDGRAARAEAGRGAAAKEEEELESFQSPTNANGFATATGVFAAPAPLLPDGRVVESLFNVQEDDDGGKAKNFKVVVRIRPPLDRETGENQCLRVHNDKAIVVRRPQDTGEKKSHNFAFDQVYDAQVSQAALYASCVQSVVLSVLDGYNGSIIAYGQTGTGKTYTVEGGADDASGIIPRASNDIFQEVSSRTDEKSKFLVRVSFLQIYNEKVADLLTLMPTADKTLRTLKVREDVDGGVYVEGLSEHVVKTAEEVRELLHRGAAMRTTAATQMNRESSRSHAVFTIIVEHSETTASGEVKITIGKLHLVDLAGSERLSKTGVVAGRQLDEMRNINASLTTFGKVVLALTSPGSHHVPYRDSKLTRILQGSLGGNCKTTMITAVTPCVSSYAETVSSLKFARRAKHVKNFAIVNEDFNEQALLSAYEKEIHKLRRELAERRAAAAADPSEVDRLRQEQQLLVSERTAIQFELESRALEAATALREKERLQRRVDALEKLLQQNGMTEGKSVALEQTPAFQLALANAEQQIRLDYETQFQELAQERQRLAQERQDLQRRRTALGLADNNPAEPSVASAATLTSTIMSFTTASTAPASPQNAPSPLSPALPASPQPGRASPATKLTFAALRTGHKSRSFEDPGSPSAHLHVAALGRQTTAASTLSMVSTTSSLPTESHGPMASSTNDHTPSGSSGSNQHAGVSTTRSPPKVAFDLRGTLPGAAGSTADKLSPIRSPIIHSNRSSPLLLPAHASSTNSIPGLVMPDLRQVQQSTQLSLSEFLASSSSSSSSSSCSASDDESVQSKKPTKRKTRKTKKTAKATHIHHPQAKPAQALASAASPALEQMQSSAGGENNTDLSSYMQLLRDSTDGVPTHERRLGHQYHKGVFSGMDAIKWFMNNMEGVADEAAALRVGQRLLDLGLIESLSQTGGFFGGDQVYYKFTSYDSRRAGVVSNIASRESSTNHPNKGANIGSSTDETRQSPATLQENTGSSSSSSSNSLGSTSRSGLAASLKSTAASLSLASPIRRFFKSRSGTTSSQTSNEGEESAADEAQRGSSVADGFLPASSSDVRDQQGPASSSHVEDQDQPGPSLADVLEPDESGITLLHSAAGQGDLLAVKNILNTFPVDVRDRVGRTPLMYASTANKPKVVELLLKAGADVQLQDNNGRNALLWSAYYGHHEVLRLLLKANPALALAEDPEGRTALHWCANHANIKPLELVLKATPARMVDHLDQQHVTPLHWSVLARHDEHASRLLKAGASVRLADSEGRTPIHYAAAADCVKLVRLFLEHDPLAVNLQDSRGRTPLHLAISSDGSLAMVQTLLACRAINIDMTDVRLTTALHWAAVCNRPDVCAALLHRGARLGFRDISGMTPLHYAMVKHHSQCADVLQGRGHK